MFRFSAGLNSVGLLQKMKESPKSFMELFCFKTSDITVSRVLEDFFQPHDLAAEGSNTRLQQDKAIAFWRDFVLAVYGLFKLIVFFSG